MGALLLAPKAAEGQDFFPRSLPGDERAAEQYLLGAEEALARGRRDEAREILRRGADFAGDSSDLSFLLARLLWEEGKPAGAVLEALGRAREAGRWNRYTPEEARLLEAEILLRLRAYEKALETLEGLPRSAGAQRLKLEAARFLPGGGEFRRFLEEALDRYPRESWPLRAFFAYAEGKLPGGNEGDLMARAFRMLPFLLEEDPELAWMAFPFVEDLEEAGRLAAAYRAAGGANPAALPALLSLGLLPEKEGVEELFAPPGEGAPGEGERRLDKGLLLRVGELLLTGEGRELFRRNLLGFTGVITEDGDGDGYAEALARYREGLITDYVYDGDQDGLPELQARFGGGLPFRAELSALPSVFAGEAPPAFAPPIRDEDRIKAVIRWEEYPAVLEASLEAVRYIPRPRDFFYAPFRLENLGGLGLLFPGGNPGRIRLSRRTLLSFAALLERPSGEFAGALERIELHRGIPERARVFLDGRLVAETEFFRGRPLRERVDLDLDGRLETVRRFRETGEDPVSAYLLRGERELLSSESDWDGDGIFEIGEEYISGDPGVIRSWDLDRDGLRETRRGD
jgi:hypothetical protein